MSSTLGQPRSMRSSSAPGASLCNAGTHSVSSTLGQPSSMRSSLAPGASLGSQERTP